jgi:hypothetical protein
VRQPVRRRPRDLVILTEAIAEAAQEAASFQDAGDEEQAKFWRRVEAVLREIRGPRQS